MADNKIAAGDNAAGDNVVEVPVAGDRPDKPSRLRAAMQRARLSEVERSDVIVNLREAEIARLELLQDALADVFEEIPADNDLLECAIVPGNPPRLWIDVLAYVAMGRDKRTYRFVKDTRFGRQIIHETTDAEDMGARVTDYVAHRLIERQRALESDDPVAVAAPAPPSPGARKARQAKGAGVGTVLLAFLAGLIAGACGLFALGLFMLAQ